MMRLHYWTLFLKTGPACNAGCVSCPAGRKGPGETEAIPLMRPDALARILDRVLEQAGIVTAVLHYYNEPTLNPHMPDLIRECRRRGIVTLISTNASFPSRSRALVEAGVDNLIVSASGWTDEVHQRSHRGVPVEAVKETMRQLSEARRPTQALRVGWHDYWYNKHEQPVMREYAEGLGFKFTPYQTSLLPLDEPVAIFQAIARGEVPAPHAGERDLATKMPEAARECAERRHFSCAYQQRMVAVDGDGVMYNCAARINGGKRGTVWDVRLEDLQRRRMSDPMCAECKAVGGHVYGAQRYKAPLGLKGAARRKAEDLWRAFGSGRLPAWVTRAIAEASYERPGKRKETE